MFACTFDISRMSSVCWFSQQGTAAKWIEEFDVAVYYVIWWCVSFEGYRQGWIKGRVFQLDGPRSNPDGGELLGPRPDRLCGPPNLLHNGYRVILGSKAIGTWHYPTTSSSVKVKESAELYLGSLLCAFIAGHRVKFTFFTCFNYGISEVRVVTENSNTTFETPGNWCFYSMDLIWVIPVLHK